MIGWFPAERRGFAMGHPADVASRWASRSARSSSRRSSQPERSTPALVFGGRFVARHGRRLRRVHRQSAAPGARDRCRGPPRESVPRRRDARAHPPGVGAARRAAVRARRRSAWSGSSPIRAGTPTAAGVARRRRAVHRAPRPDRRRRAERPGREPPASAALGRARRHPAAAAHRGRRRAASSPRSSRSPTCSRRCVSVADNGLAFTAVAEIAGAHWSGRALGAQNTGQFLAAALVAPLVGAAHRGGRAIRPAFALIALAPLAVAIRRSYARAGRRPPAQRRDRCQDGGDVSVYHSQDPRRQARLEFGHARARAGPDHPGRRARQRAAGARARAGAS